MLTLEEVLKGHNSRIENTALEIQDRLGARLCRFLTEDQAKSIGFVREDLSKPWPQPIPFTEENVLAQLKADVLFGWEKACNHRGISSSLMYDVVMGWCQILQNEFANFNDYAPYGTPLFIAVSNKYNFGINESDFIDSDDF